MFFVVNPASARGRTLEIWNSLTRELTRFGLTYTCHITSRPGEAIEVARDALRCGEETVIAVGGDGTLNEILNGYLDASGRPLSHTARIGVLPTGTGSDFSRSVDIPTGPSAFEAVGRMLAGGRSRQIDAVDISFVNETGREQSRYMIMLRPLDLGAMPCIG